MVSRVQRVRAERIGRLWLLDTATMTQVVGEKPRDGFLDRVLPTRDVRVDHIQPLKACMWASCKSSL